MLQRSLRLAVAFWAYNMTVAYSQASYYPGFNYNDDEKAEMAAIAGKVSGTGFYVWIAIAVVLFIAMAAGAAGAQIFFVTSVTGSNPASTRLFFLSFGVVLLASFTIALPGAMLFSAALVGRWFKIAQTDLPDRATAARYVHKLLSQLALVGIVMVIGIIGALLFIPDDSKFLVILRVTAPLASVVVSVLSAVLYFSRREIGTPPRL